MKFIKLLLLHKIPILLPIINNTKILTGSNIPWPSLPSDWPSFQPILESNWNPLFLDEIDLEKRVNKKTGELIKTYSSNEADCVFSCSLWLPITSLLFWALSVYPEASDVFSELKFCIPNLFFKFCNSILWHSLFSVFEFFSLGSSENLSRSEIQQFLLVVIFQKRKPMEMLQSTYFLICLKKEFVHISNYSFNT